MSYSWTLALPPGPDCGRHHLSARSSSPLPKPFGRLRSVALRASPLVVFAGPPKPLGRYRITPLRLRSSMLLRSHSEQRRLQPIASLAKACMPTASTLTSPGPQTLDRWPKVASPTKGSVEKTENKASHLICVDGKTKMEGIEEFLVSRVL